MTFRVYIRKKMMPQKTLPHVEETPLLWKIVIYNFISILRFLRDNPDRRQNAPQPITNGWEDDF